jgi:hypothetical protein
MPQTTKRQSVLTRDDGTGELWGAFIFALVALVLAAIAMQHSGRYSPAYFSCLVPAGIYAYRCYDKDPSKGAWAIGAAGIGLAGLIFAFWFSGHQGSQLTNKSRAPLLAPQTSKGNAPSPGQTQTAAQTNPPPGSFDWNHFADTGGLAYSPLQPAQFDPNDHSGDDTVVQKFPIDSPARPDKNEDGSDPQIETDDKGQQWAVYTSHVPANSKVNIEGLRLNPTTIGGRPYLFGSVTVSNLTPYPLVGLQIVYESGDLKTTILTTAQAASEMKEPIKPHTGMALQIKSYAPNKPSTVPNLLLEAQIQGPPGLLTDEAELEEVTINAAGQVISR